MTLLHKAACYGHKEIASLLLGRRADIEAKDWVWSNLLRIVLLEEAVDTLILYVAHYNIF
jgi:ankyrin repeat protein